MTIFTNGPNVRTSFIQDQIPTMGTVLLNAATEAFTRSPFSSIARSIDATNAQEGNINPDTFDTGGFDFEVARDQPTSDVLSIDDQQKQIKEAGVHLKPVEGLRSDALQILIDTKLEELKSQSIHERSTTAQGIAGFGAGIVGSLFDPINIAASFIPIFGQLRFAAAAVRAATPIGRNMIRATQGALAGAQGAILVEPIVFSQAQQEQADYNMNNAMLNIVFGTFLGAGLHTGAGAIGDKIRSVRTAHTTAQLQDKLQVFKDDLALAINDQNPVGHFRVADLLTDPTLADRGIADLGRAGEAPRIHYETTTVKIPRGVPIEEIDQRVRATDPATFEELDKLSRQLEVIRKQTPLEAQQVSEAQLLVDRYAELESKRNTKDKRILKRLDKQQAQVLTKLKEIGFTDKIVAAKSKITRLNTKGKASPSKVKVIENQITPLKKKADRAFKKVLKQTKNEKRFDVSHPVTGINTTDLAKFAKSKQNSRLTDFQMLDQQVQQFVDQGSGKIELNEVTAKSELADAVTRIDDLKKQLGSENEDLFNEVQHAIEQADDTIVLAQVHKDALLAAFTCGVR